MLPIKDIKKEVLDNDADIRNNNLQEHTSSEGKEKHSGTSVKKKKSKKHKDKEKVYDAKIENTECHDIKTEKDAKKKKKHKRKSQADEMIGNLNETRIEENVTKKMKKKKKKTKYIDVKVEELDADEAYDNQPVGEVAVDCSLKKKKKKKQKKREVSESTANEHEISFEKSVSQNLSVEENVVLKKRKKKKHKDKNESVSSQGERIRTKERGHNESIEKKSNNKESKLIESTNKVCFEQSNEGSIITKMNVGDDDTRKDTADDSHASKNIDDSLRKKKKRHISSKDHQTSANKDVSRGDTINKNRKEHVNGAFAGLESSHSIDENICLKRQRRSKDADSYVGKSTNSSSLIGSQAKKTFEKESLLVSGDCASESNDISVDRHKKKHKTTVENHASNNESDNSTERRLFKLKRVQTEKNGDEVLKKKQKQMKDGEDLTEVNSDNCSDLAKVSNKHKKKSKKDSFRHINVTPSLNLELQSSATSIENFQPSEFHLKWHLSAQDKKDLEKQGIKFEVGRWRKEELKKLEENFQDLLVETGETQESLIKLIYDKSIEAKRTRQELSVYPKLLNGINRPVKVVQAKIKKALDPDHLKGKWMKKDEEKLLELYKRYGNNWVLIGEMIGRSRLSVSHKVKRLLCGDLNDNASTVRVENTGNWTEDEKERLDEAVTKYKDTYESGNRDEDKPSDIAKYINWSLISQAVGTRSSESCRRQWVYCVSWKRPGGKYRIWTNEQSITFIEALSKCGGKDDKYVDWDKLFDDLQLPGTVPLMKRKWKEFRQKIPNYKDLNFEQQIDWLIKHYVAKIQSKGKYTQP